MDNTPTPTNDHRGTMTELFERELRRVIEHFIAEVLAMAQRAAIEVIQSAFTPRAKPTEASNTGGRRLLGRSAAYHSSARSDSPTVSASVVAFVREHPGWSTAEISQSLGLHTTMARHYLRQLADQGVIRIEVASLGGVTRRTYFSVIPVDERSAARAGGATTTETDA